MNEIEAIFVKTFISHDRRERWLSLLASDKNRHKLLHRLAHIFDDDLDPRFVYEKDNPPPEVAARVEKVLAEWRKANREQLCHIIANSSDHDGRMMNLKEAEADYDLTFGAIIIVIPDKLAYYHTERSNLNKQPFYVMFHP